MAEASTQGLDRHRSLLLLVLGVLACGSPPPPADATRASAARAQQASAAPMQETFGSDLSSIELKSQAVRMLLPGRSGWRRANEGSWVVLRHAATDSTLRVKHWRAPRLVRHEECRAQAALGQPSQARPRDEELLDTRRVAAPHGYDGELSVHVRELGGELHGRAELFSADIGRCFAATFDTVAAGPSRERDVGQRLNVIVEEVFVSFETLSVEQRVTR